MMNRYDTQRRDYQHMVNIELPYISKQQDKLVTRVLHIHQRHPHMPRPLSTQR